MSDDSIPSALRPAWKALLLLCKDCSKRSNGPRHFKAKDAASELKRVLRDAPPRPRIVLTTCLGLCPKRQMAVAMVGAGPIEVVGVKTLPELVKAMPALLMKQR